MRNLNNAVELFWYALRGGQDDALNALRIHEKRLEPLHALGADIDERIRDAVLLEAGGITRDQLFVLRKIVATGRFTADQFIAFQRLGIDMRPVADWLTRHTDSPTAEEVCTTHAPLRDTPTGASGGAGDHVREVTKMVPGREKAHTPSSDARELAFRRARDAWMSEKPDLYKYSEFYTSWDAGFSAGWDAAAGFRRTVQGEPSDVQALLADADRLVESWNRMGSWDAVMRLARALRAAGVVTEQGEKP